MKSGFGETSMSRRIDPLIFGGDDINLRYPALRGVFEDLTERLSSRFSEIVGLQVEIEFSGVTSGKIGEIHSDLSEGAPGVIFFSRALNAKMAFVANPPFVDALADLLFGANAIERQSNDARPTTNIESQAIMFFGGLLADALREALSRAISFDVDPLQASPVFDLNQLGRNGAQILICAFSMSALGGLSGMTLIIPRSALDPYREQLARVARTDDSRQPDSKWTSSLRDTLMRTDVLLSAVIDRKELTLRDVAAFEIGQIVMLSAGPSDLIRFECDGHPVFEGQLGQNDGHYSIRIEHFVNQDEEFFEQLLRG